MALPSLGMLCSDLKENGETRVKPLFKFLFNAKREIRATRIKSKNNPNVQHTRHVKLGRESLVLGTKNILILRKVN